MLSLNENELKELLESKRRYIERPVLMGIGEFIAGISLFITLCTSQFNSIPIVDTDWFKFLMFTISILTILVSIVSIIKRVISRQTIQNLLENIQELDAQKVHTVNIILLRNTPQEGKYLLVKNRIWKCELFPSYNSLSKDYNVQSELAKIKQFFTRNVGISNVTVTYIKPMDTHIKLCVGTGIRYRYAFHFYQVELNSSDVKMKKNFTYNGNKYVWKSLNQMQKSKNIIKKNGDVVHFVAELESIPYN